MFATFVVGQHKKRKSPSLSSRSCTSNDDVDDENADLSTTRTSISLNLPQSRAENIRGVCFAGKPKQPTRRLIEASLTSETLLFNASSLSVLRIGPVTGLHRSNNNGTCVLFANFIVGSIAHECEQERDGVNLTNEFFIRRECLFASSVARRTKFKQTHSDLADRRPAALIWTDPETGIVSRITEMTAIRTLLVEMYIRLVVQSDCFATLARMLNLGFDIALLGETSAVVSDEAKLQSEMWKCFNWEEVLAQKLNESAEFI